MTDAVTAAKFKASGNDAFKAGEYVRAIGEYTRAIQLDASNPLLPLNRAMAYLKLNKFEDAERDCTATLELQPGNAKALYRRGVARKGLQNYVSAISDLEQAKIVDASNESVRTELAECLRLLGEAKAAAKAKAAKAAAVRSRPTAFEAEEPPVPSTSKAAIQSESDPSLMREVSSRRLPNQQNSSFGAAKESRQAKEKKQRSVLGMPSVNAHIAETSRPPIIANPPSSKTASSPAIMPSSISSINGHRTHTPSAYDFRLALNEYSDEQWKPAWAYISSISPSHYGKMFESSLEPDVLSKLLLVMHSALLSDAHHAEQSSDILKEVSRSPRFDFIAMLLADTERQAAQSILKAGGHDSSSPLWRTWCL